MPFVINTLFCPFDATLKKGRKSWATRRENERSTKKKSKKISNPRKQHRDSPSKKRSFAYIFIFERLKWKCQQSKHLQKRDDAFFYCSFIFLILPLTINSKKKTRIILLNLESAARCHLGAAVLRSYKKRWLVDDHENKDESYIQS